MTDKRENYGLSAIGQNIAVHLLNAGQYPMRSFFFPQFRWNFSPKWQGHRSLLALSVTGLTIGFAPMTLGQVVSDSSVGTIVTGCETGICAITGGQVGQGNLFHSFDQLSWGADRGISSVVFQGEGGADVTPVDRIFARVTGTLPSTIDGLLQTTGHLRAADFFLLNPQGVLFGENAKLDLGGSFIVSSGDRFWFENGVFFSARDQTFAPDLLQVSVPLGLQYGTGKPGEIRVQGRGATVTGVTNALTQIQSTAAGLTVAPGQTLALLGGSVLVNGAALQAPQGNLVLLGLGESDALSIALTPGFGGSGWQFQLPSEPWSLQPITLENGSLGSANNGLYGVASNLTLTGGSYLLSQGSGTNPSGTNPGATLQLKVSDRLYLTGQSTIVTEATGATPGNSLRISASHIALDNGGRLLSLAFGEGQAGNITLDADQSLEVIGQTPALSGNSTQIRSSTLAAGNPGRIRIRSPFVSLSNGGVIASTTLNPSTGDAGDINIEAQTLEVRGVEPSSLQPSAIRSASLSQGDAGVVQINSDRVVLEEGGRISTLTAHVGTAGELRINARESIVVQGVGLGNNLSSIIVGATILSPGVRADFGLPNVPQGNGGELWISTPQLRVTEGGLITADNQGSGDSGSIWIRTENTEVSRGGQISALALSGQSGNVEIDTHGLTLNQGVINTSTLGSGQGGNINLRATGTIALNGTPNALVTLFNQFPLYLTDVSSFLSAGFSSGLISGLLSLSLNEGNGGSIDINAANLSLSNGSFVVASSFSTGNSGAIRLRIKDTIDLDSSYVATTPFASGKAGDLVLDTQRLNTRNGALLTTNSFGQGNGGNLTVNATEAIDLSDDRNFTFQDLSFLGGLRSGSLVLLPFNSPQQISGNGGDLRVTTPELRIRNGAILSSAVEGSGDAGDIYLTTDRLILESNGSISSLSTTGLGGNIHITANDSVWIKRDGVFPDFVSLQETPTDPNAIRTLQSLGISSLSSGSAGDITITTDRFLLENAALVISASLGAGTGGDFNLTANSVTLSDSFIATSGLGSGDAGDINLSTRTLDTSQRGVLTTFTAGAGSAGDINIQARDKIHLKGLGQPNPFFPVGLSASGLTGSTGSSGSILITTPQLIVEDQAEISASALGYGNGGNIVIHSDRVWLNNNGFISSISTIGESGLIEINATESLAILNNRIVGNDLIAFVANVILTSSVNRDGFISLVPQLQGLGITSFSTGSLAGNIDINTGLLRLNNGGSLITSNLGNGESGDLTIEASNIQLQDSFLVASSTGQGNAGNIEVTTDRLSLSGISSFGTFALGTGNAGDITINAQDSVEIKGTTSVPITVLNGGLFANAERGNQGGNITIATSDLNLAQNARISAYAGEGIAGNLLLKSDRFSLDNSRLIANSTLGQGGNIDILATEQFILQQNSSISTAAGTPAGGGGNGGNISITTPLLVALPQQNNDIVANAFQGAGGNIQITGTGIYGFTFANVDQPAQDPDNNVTASSQSGLSGNTTVSQEIEASPSLNPFPAQVVDPTLAIGIDLCRASRENSFLATGSGGIPPSARQVAIPTSLWDDRRELLPTRSLSVAPPLPNSLPHPVSESSSLGREFDSLASKAALPKPPGDSTPILEAQGWYKTIAGEVILTRQAYPSSVSASPHFQNCP